MPRKLPELTEAEVTTLVTITMLGLTDDTARALIREQHGRNIPKRTYVRWKKEHPQVRESRELGSARSEHIAARTIWGAMVQTDDMNLAVRTAQYWEQSRHGRSHKTEQKVEIKGELKGGNAGVQIYIPHNGRDSVKLSSSEPPDDQD